MWEINSEGKVAAYNNDFPITSTLVMGGLGFIITATWLVIWAAKNWGFSGVMGGLATVCWAYCLASWVSCRLAKRRWRLEQVKKKMKDAAHV